MSNDYKQLIFCLETTEKAKTDKFYIKEVLRYYFKVGYNKLSYVYLEGKHNYNTSRIKDEIKTLVDKYGEVSDSYIIYVLDKDENTVNPRDNEFVRSASEYCEQNDYKLVWFIKDVEDVMWGKKVSNNKKVDEAKRFLTSKQIEKVNISNLKAASNVNSRYKSNIITELSKIEEIKKPN